MKFVLPKNQPFCNTTIATRTKARQGSTTARCCSDL